MRSRIRHLAAAAVVLVGSTVASAEGVGDLPDFGEDAYFQDDAASVDKESASDQDGPPQKSDEDKAKAAKPAKPAAPAEEPVRITDLILTEFPEPQPPTLINGVQVATDAPAVGDLLSPEESEPAPELQTQAVKDVNPSPVIKSSAVGDMPVVTDIPLDTAARRIPAAVIDPRPKFRAAAHPTPAELYKPVAQSSHSISHGSCDGVGCDGSCDGSCGGHPRHGILDLFDRCDGRYWAQTEALLWFTQRRESPPLVSTSPAGVPPILPPRGTASVAYGDPLGGGLSGGIRGDYGKWVSDRLGFGGRFWWLGRNSDKFQAGGDGTNQSIGRPYYDIGTAQQDAILVAFDSPAGAFSGTLSANSWIEMWALEGYARSRQSCSKNHFIDLIGGYSHFEIDDHLHIQSRSIQTTPATGRINIFSDMFDTENRFNGGQLGFELGVRHGRWSLRSMTKVHLGNMHQRVRIAGNSSVQTPPAPPTNFPISMLAQDGNIGTHTRNKFTFAPEANIKLAYCLRKNVLLTLGYTFIYWNDVALAGAQVDPNLDANLLLQGISGTRPLFQFNDSSLWNQGIDLGMIVNF